MSNIQDALHELGRLQEEMDVLHTQFLKIQDDLEKMTQRAEKAEAMVKKMKRGVEYAVSRGYVDLTEDE